MPVINKSEIGDPEDPEEPTSCFSCSFEKVDGIYRVTGTETLTNAQATALQSSCGLLNLACNPTDGVRAVLPKAQCGTLDGLLRLRRIDQDAVTIEDTQFGFEVKSNQVNIGGYGSFYGDDAIGSVLALPSIAFTQNGPTQGVLIRGYYETRNLIYSGTPATMNTQLQASIDGGTNWVAVSSNHANFSADPAAPGSDNCQPVMNRFGSVDPAAYTVDFRLVLLASSSASASDEILTTQARLSVTWIGPVCA